LKRVDEWATDWSNVPETSRELEQLKYDMKKLKNIDMIPRRFFYAIYLVLALVRIIKLEI